MTRQFEYHVPQSLDETLALLDQYGKAARLLAGGTDLLLNIRAGAVQPEHIINIKRIDELYRLEVKHDTLHIGALVSVSELMDSPIISTDYAALSEAAASMAAVQIRNMATVGGNLCNASPAADLAPPLIALDAQVEIAASNGQRTLPLTDLFLGPGKTALKPNETLVAVTVPKPAPDQQSIFLKMSPRGAMDIAIASVAVSLTSTDERCEDIRIVMGAVGPTPLRAEASEAALRGKSLSSEYIHQAAQLAADEARPIDDVRASAWYRKSIVETLTRRALGRLIGESA